MKTRYKIINGKDFIKARPTGEIDLEQSKKLLVQLAAMANPPADYEILIDVREMYGNLNYADMWELVAELGRVWAEKGKLIRPSHTLWTSGLPCWKLPALLLPGQNI